MRGLLFIPLAACSTNATPIVEPPAAVQYDCIPNLDGTITADEMPVALGVTAPYYVGMDRAVDQLSHGGTWNFSDERPDDSIVKIGPTQLQSQWYAASFPAGQFVVDAGGGLDGIYHQDAQGLWLDGTASQQPGNKTLIVYPQPIAVLRYPLRAGDMWTTTATLASVTVNGLPFNGTDEVTVEAIEAGELALPYVEFEPTLRVRTNVVRKASSGGASTGRRQTLWLFECFGEIARAESRPDETNADFTTAAYFRRFALGVDQ
jgi:hypothetical protein